MDPGASAIRSGEPPALPLRADSAAGWPMAVQIAAILLVTSAGFFLLGRWSAGSTPGAAEATETSGPMLDLNRASKAELRLIPGMGDSLAQRVIDHRQRNGSYRSVDDLRLISGIGPRTFDRIRPHLFVIQNESFVGLDEEEVMPTESKRSMPTASVPSKKLLALKSAINVNQANQTELQKLPGIGPKISQRILDERARARFKSVDELRRVSGIGPKTLEKLRPYVTIE